MDQNPHIRLQQDAKNLGYALKQRGQVLALAESCTGGMVSAAITSISGSSAWFDRGFVTYSNTAKIEMLKVTEQTLINYGAVSEATAIEMAQGALSHSHADISGSITGIAGPDGGTPEKPVGMVCFAWAIRNGKTHASTQYFSGSREQIREQAASYLMLALLNQLK